MKHNLDDIYQYIVTYKTDHDGNSPSFREIGHACGISSTSMVKSSIMNLIRDKRLALNGQPFRSRCIEVVGGHWVPPEEASDANK